MERKKFNVTCCKCRHTLKNIKIGEDSFVEIKCPNCGNLLMVVTKKDKIKVKSIITMGYAYQEANKNVELWV